MRSQPSSPRAGESSSDQQPEPRPPSPRCWIVLAHPDLGLAPALLHHLRAEVAGLEFAAEESPRLHSIWLCGYEPGALELLRAIRARHPEALVLVTRRGALDAWAAEALLAGADEVRAWPLHTRELARVLLQRRGEPVQPG